jgi:hypothetical protein
MFLALMFGAAVSIITWWTVQVFMPFAAGFSLSIAIINGLIYSIPLIIQNEVFRI